MEGQEGRLEESHRGRRRGRRRRRGKIGIRNISRRMSRRGRTSR